MSDMDRLLGWHEWFAWRPIRLGGRWAWWRWVERRFSFAFHANAEWTQYREIP